MVLMNVVSDLKRWYHQDIVYVLDNPLKFGPCVFKYSAHPVCVYIEYQSIYLSNLFNTGRNDKDSISKRRKAGFKS